jgi:hypothetical protein
MNKQSLTDRHHSLFNCLEEMLRAEGCIDSEWSARCVVNAILEQGETLSDQEFRELLKQTLELADDITLK